ncbi:MAG: hypothetical protein IJH32_10015 [Ruminococcus sp.]|nr:hypothetical protein [Ruminococcus sp.]
MLKIVYVYVGTEKKEYLNMLRISVRSAVKHMPDTPIIILTDRQTGDYLQESGVFLADAAEILSVEIPDGYNTVEKSRYLKTNLRELIDGDLLYIDCDVIICEDISDLSADTSVSMALDEHGLLSQQDDGGAAIRRAAKARGLDVDACIKYFNGGVILAKDDDNAHQFFRRWFEVWDATRKPSMHHDQYSLNAVNLEMDVIGELDGTYNCQLTATYRAFSYLRNVKILHYLSAQPDGIYQLNDIEYLRKDFTDEEIDAIVSDPVKRFLPFHFYADSSVEYRIMQQSHFHLIYRLYTRHRKLYDFGEKILGKLRK